MPPTHLQLMRHSILARAPRNGFQQVASTVGLPNKKAQVLSQSHAQNEAQIDHPQRISWLLVAISNATRTRVTALGWLKNEEEDEQF